jgi:thioredoxin-related protein
MKRPALIIVLFLLITPAATLEAQDTINWMDITELETAMSEDPKPVFFDVYTDWCGWCKRMDATTFKDPQVVALLNEKFHPVKFDGERKDTFTFREHQFKYVASGRRGYNELTGALLNGQLSYPSFVALNEEFERITIIKGYQQTKEFVVMLNYLADKHYLEQTWEDYRKSRTGK